MVTVPFAAGQAIDVTVQHGSCIYRKEAYYPGPGAKHFPIVTVVERMVNITEADNATIFRDLEWSYRRKGETKLTAMLANETARISVPDKPAETVFEFLLTCTGGVRNGGSKLQAEGCETRGGRVRVPGHVSRCGARSTPLDFPPFQSSFLPFKSFRSFLKLPYPSQPIGFGLNLLLLPSTRANGLSPASSLAPAAWLHQAS